MTAMTTDRIHARRPALDRGIAARLAETEYRRFVAALGELADADWSRSTDCPAWDVRSVAAHVLGQAEMVASTRELIRQNLLAERAGGGIDALTELQVRERADLGGPAVAPRFETVIPRALRGRRRVSRLVGWYPLAEFVGPDREWWRLRYVADVILTRDTWMHRMDIARATGRRPHLTPDHDGVIVADVVAEWAQRHGRPYRLRLTGPAGGEWASGAGGQELELDAVEFCRVLSGRGSGTGLLAQPVPF